MEIELKKLGEITTGNTPSKKDGSYWDSEDICFVKPDRIADEGITLINDSSEYISENARSKARVVSKDAVFVTCIGSIGKIGIASSGDYAFNQQINAITPNQSVLPIFLYYLIRNSGEYIRDNSSTGMKHILTKAKFESLSFPVPPLELQQQFEEKINEILIQKNLIRQSIAETQRLLDYKMDYYFG